MQLTSLTLHKFFLELTVNPKPPSALTLMRGLDPSSAAAYWWVQFAALLPLLCSHESCCVFAAVGSVGWLKGGGLPPRLYVCHPVCPVTLNTLTPRAEADHCDKMHPRIMNSTRCLRKHHLYTPALHAVGNIMSRGLQSEHSDHIFCK